MSATSSSSDKFLFLFTTDSDNYGPIKTALQQYYKLPAAGTNTFEAAGCLNFQSGFKSVIEALRGTDPDPTINTYTQPDPSGKIPATDLTKTLTLVVVISGNADSTGLIDNGSNKLSWAKIRDTLAGTIPNPLPKTYNYQLYTEVHVVFASPFCNSFLTAWDGLVPVTNGTLIIAPTVADLINQTDRESFLASWANALQLGTTIPLDSYGRISFNDIPASISGSTFRTVGAGIGGKYFPGYSYLEIHDGSPDWWESDDIYINYYNNDLYTPDVDNTVFVNVHTVGTHPVKEFWIGAKHFGSGLGSSDANIVTHLVAGDANLPAVLKAGESCLYQYTQLFAPGTVHRCVVARAKFTVILSTDIDDYSEWSIVANADEAQRNTDPLTPAPAPAEPPAPDTAQDPDPDPAPDDEDQNNTGDRTLNNLRGFKEHVYSILNTFREKRKFRLVLHEEFKKHSDLFKVAFLPVQNGKALKPLRIVNEPYPHIPFTIESGEKAEFIFYLSLNPKVRLKRDIRLPMEFLVEIKGLRPANLRKSKFTKADKSFVPVGGITVNVRPQKFSIYGHVYDKKRKPVPGAQVHIRTVNGRQAAVLKTDKKGAYTMPGINPDAYRMTAVTGDWYTKYKLVNLFTRDLDIDFIEGN